MALLEPIVAEPPPVALDAGGTARVGGTRVTLDTVVGAWRDGATAEEIVSSYDVLTLADVHATVAYYLRHQESVDAYLKQRQDDADTLRRKIEKTYPSPPGLRDLLIARRAQAERRESE